MISANENHIIGPYQYVVDNDQQKLAALLNSIDKFSLGISYIRV
jgi:hypothetical protein